MGNDIDACVVASEVLERGLVVLKLRSEGNEAAVVWSLWGCVTQSIETAVVGGTLLIAPRWTFRFGEQNLQQFSRKHMPRRVIPLSPRLLPLSPC